MPKTAWGAKAIIHHHEKPKTGSTQKQWSEHPPITEAGLRRDRMAIKRNPNVDGVSFVAWPGCVVAQVNAGECQCRLPGFDTATHKHVHVPWSIMSYQQA
jgi:hypothetical protein